MGWLGSSGTTFQHTAVRFFLKVSPERLAFVRAMTLAQLFCIAGGGEGLGLSLLAATWLLVAIGVRRAHDVAP